MTPLALTGDIPGLLRRGSPVLVRFGDVLVPGVYAMADERPEDKRNGPHTIAPVDEWPPATDFNGSAAMSRSCRDDEVALDLTDPLGLHTAILWLRERGHEVPATWPVEAVAWSVLSVSRGGEPINRRILTWWLVNPRWPERHFRSVVGTDHNNSYATWYVNESRWRWGFAFECGGLAQTEAEGKALADAAALAANYALTNDDGTLTLPALPVLP